MFLLVEGWLLLEGPHPCFPALQAVISEQGPLLSRAVTGTRQSHVQSPPLFSALCARNPLDLQQPWASHQKQQAGQADQQYAPKNVLRQRTMLLLRAAMQQPLLQLISARMWVPRLNMPSQL